MTACSEIQVTRQESSAGAVPAARHARQGLFDASVIQAAGIEDPKLMEEILIMYLVASTDLLRELFHRQRMGDAPGLADGAAHLRELADAVGALRLAERCRLLAGAADRTLGAGQEIEELFALDQELDRSQSAVRAHLQGWDRG